MIRSFHLADWFTLGNAVCGMGGRSRVMTYLRGRRVAALWCAPALMPAAFAFDVLDGRIARWRHSTRRWAASWIRWPT